RAAMPAHIAVVHERWAKATRGASVAGAFFGSAGGQCLQGRGAASDPCETNTATPRYCDTAAVNRIADRYFPLTPTARRGGWPPRPLRRESSRRVSRTPPPDGTSLYWSIRRGRERCLCSLCRSPQVKGSAAHGT